MIRPLRSLCLRSALLFLCFSAQAAESDDATVYAGLEFGKVISSSVTYEQSGEPVFGLALGYLFSRNLAIEGFARNLSFRFLDELFGEGNYYPTDHYGVALVGTVPISERAHLLARLGVGRTTMHANSATKPDFHTTDPSVGAGVGYHFATRASVKLSATRFTKSRVTTTLVGVEYRF